MVNTYCTISVLKSNGWSSYREGLGQLVGHIRCIPTCCSWQSWSCYTRQPYGYIGLVIGDLAYKPSGVYTQQIPGSSCNDIIRHTQQIPGTSLPWDHQAHTADLRLKFAMRSSGTHSSSQPQVCYQIIRHTQPIPGWSLVWDHQAHTADPRLKFAMRSSGTHSRPQAMRPATVLPSKQQLQQLN